MRIRYLAPPLVAALVFASASCALAATHNENGHKTVTFGHKAKYECAEDVELWLRAGGDIRTGPHTASCDSLGGTDKSAAFRAGSALVSK